MANEQQPLRPWFLDVVPLMVVLLIAGHVFALISHSKAAAAKKVTLKEPSP